MARRFVTYNTEDQKAGRVNVDHNGVMMPGAGGSGLPSGGEPYMQLVTDGEGKWVAEKRLAWKEGEKVEITWDGNTEGLETVNLPAAVPVYRVSDLILSDEAIKNGTLTSNTGYVTQISDNWDSMVSSGWATEDFVVSLSEGWAFTRVPNATLGSFVFPTPGVYFGKSPYSEYYTQSFVSDNQTIHPIPEEYIPKTPVVRVAYSEDADYYVADKTYDEITEMLVKGVFPVCIYERNVVLPLTGSSALNDVMPLASLPWHHFSAYRDGRGYEVLIQSDNAVIYSEKDILK